MLYTFSKTSEPIDDNLTITSETALTFVYQAVALSEKANVKIENITSEMLTAVYDDAGVQSNFYDNRLYLSKKPVSHEGVLIKDFSDYPHLAIPFAIVCAAKGIAADLKGLESLVQEKGTAVISRFQKEIYRFHINTDFCDYSKLKIYNNKVMQQKSKPVNTGGDDFLSISLIPLACFFGKIEMELPDDFKEKNSEIMSLVSALNFQFNEH